MQETPLNIYMFYIIPFLCLTELKKFEPSVAKRLFRKILNHSEVGPLKGSITETLIIIRENSKPPKIWFCPENEKDVNTSSPTDQGFPGSKWASAGLVTYSKQYCSYWSLHN